MKNSSTTFQIGQIQPIEQTPQGTTTSIPLFEVISIIGIVSVLGAFIYIGRKLQVLDSVDKCVEKIKINMNVISTYLTRYHTKFDPDELQTFSPFQLTDDGKQFIKTVGFDNVFETHKSDFFDLV